MEYQDIFAIKNSQEFEQKALDVFRYQFEHNTVYRSFCDLLYKNPSDIKTVAEIPFLPISFFKSHEVVSSQKETEAIFTSSGTTGSITSKHYVKDLSLYETSFQKGFTQSYGAIEEYVVLALLPSYLEREGSSLVYMVDHLIKASKHEDSGFYLDDYFALSEKLKDLDTSGKKVLLIGVSFALLDLIENDHFSLQHTIIMETGGMKGKRKEMIREELHAMLSKGFGVSEIHSEYGMTELLSQAYSNGKGVFTTPPWMKILIRDPEDPLTIFSNSKTGGLNVIDLANIHSCSFIATQDLGRIHPDGSFSVVGRFDNSDIRGCNLMVL
ncbi:acyl transferase [uncultured Dokdonia sp.]|uniref:LuxE/PaaK family acyltransferase n=1 Tax=uncultured Dokdonia sp. TaxID=575653 RepID=UPI0026222C9F|nr:acyl transferase [uncultured Dokdonia sp.]